MFDTDQLKQFSKSTLRDETATDEEKIAARVAIQRIKAAATTAKGRPKRPKRKDYESEESHQLALREFRSTLDKMAIEREAAKILDDPTSSVYLRRKARETLYGPDPEPESAPIVKTTEGDPPEPSHKLTTIDKEERDRAQKFLDSICKHGLPVEAPKLEPKPKKVEPPLKPIDPGLSNL